MADDTGFTGESGGPRGPGMGGCCSFLGGFRKCQQRRSWPGLQEVDPCHQAVPPGQEHEGQVPGGDPTLLLGHQGI